jgi:hypothetical protein
MIKKFIKSESERNQPVTVEYKTASGEIKEEEILLIDFNSKEEAMSPDANEKGFIHPMTLTDLMFMIANDVLVEKNYHVYVTRYPASEFQNIYPSRIKIKTTAKTKNIWMTPYDEDEKGYMEHMLINYKNYPIIQYPNGPKYTESETRLFNVFNPGNIYLKAMGGDFDGDMM